MILPHNRISPLRLSHQIFDDRRAPLKRQRKAGTKLLRRQPLVDITKELTSDDSIIGQSKETT